MIRAPSATYVPRPDLTRLLRAAVLNGDPAAHAWRQSRGLLDRPSAQRDPAANWLRPLLGANLDRLGIDDPLLEELRRTRSETESRNSHLFEHVGRLVDRLRDQGIDTMLLKGAALVAAGIDPGTRPMSDVDLLVPLRDAQSAATVTSASGWTARHEVTSGFIAVKHAAHYADDDGCQLDLHWYVFEDCRRPGMDDGIWARAVPANVDGAQCVRPSPADALLHACVHGARWTRTPGIRWATDAMAIIEGGDVEWETLIAEAGKRSFIVRLRSTLGYLRRALRAPMPDWVARQLADSRPGFMERLEHASLGYEQRRLGELPSYWFGFHRVHKDKPMALLTFPAFLGTAWGADSPSAIARAAISRARARIAGTATGR